MRWAVLTPVNDSLCKLNDFKCSHMSGVTNPCSQILYKILDLYKLVEKRRGV